MWYRKTNKRFRSSRPCRSGDRNLQVSPKYIQKFMTDKGMSFSFSYTYHSRKKTHKALQNLDKKKHVKKMMSPWK